MKKTYAILNFIVILAVIYWNYYTTIYGINGNDVGSLSREYANLFTPASYAFSIWGLIFLSLVAHSIFQIKRTFFSQKSDNFVEQIGLLLLVTNVANGLWVYFWLSEMTRVSVLIMLTMLICLITIMLRLNMQRKNVSLPFRLLVWWPIGLYSGWIAVATIANIAAFLAKIGWQGFLGEVPWTVIMIIVATAVNFLVLYRRNMPVFAGVGVWALVAIAARHWDSMPIIQWTAVAGAIILVGSIGWFLIKQRRVAA